MPIKGELMSEMNLAYSCAVVEVGPGKYEVTTPGDVAREADIYSKGGTGTAQPGKYAGVGYLFVSGGEGVPSVEEFRANVATIVNRVVAQTTPDKPATLDDIRRELPSTHYRVSKK